MQTSCLCVSDNDRLYAIDTVHAHDLGPRHHRDLAGGHARASAEASPKASPYSRLARTQDDENASAALQSVDSSSVRVAAVTENDKIDRSDHSVDVRVPSLTTTSALSVAKQAHLRASARHHRRGVVRRVATARYRGLNGEVGVLERSG